MKRETKHYTYSPGTYVETTFDKEEVLDLKLSEDEVAFILCAINNYSGHGPPRDEVLRKLHSLVSMETVEYVAKTWGSVFSDALREMRRRMHESADDA